MSILKFLSGPDPERLEKKGDDLLTSGLWGAAKIEYERALARAEKKGLLTRSSEMRLTEKLERAREGLAEAHQKTAEEYMESGYYDEARSYLSLAREMTSDESRIRGLDGLAEKLVALRDAETKAEMADAYYGLGDEQAGETVAEVPQEEQFQALCAALSPEIREAYLSYDKEFRAGYLALNAGEFEAAATHLARAMTADSDPGSYIPLELATAYLHLGKSAEARALLVPFIERHPEALPAYQLLCDLCWEEKDFQRADALIDSVPEDLADSVAVVLLRGETRYHAGDVDAARTLYQTVLDNRGWQMEIALALAKTHEAGGDDDAARLLYRDIMGRCAGCGAKIDPAVKHKYAELSFDAGIHDTHVLELYLALVREIPENAPEYYARVSRIYTEQGNETEAARFRVFAQRASE